MSADAPPTYIDAVNATSDRTLVADSMHQQPLQAKRPPVPPAPLNIGHLQAAAPASGGGPGQLPPNAYGHDAPYTPGAYHTAPNTPMYTPGLMPPQHPYGHPAHGVFNYGMPMMPMPQQQQQQIIMIPQAAHAPAAAPTNVIVNSNANSNAGAGTGAGGLMGMGCGGREALVCPKCRRGIIIRVKSRFMNKLVNVLAVLTCPLTCCLPCLMKKRIFVDMCGACGKKYGHMGKKRPKR